MVQFRTDEGYRLILSADDEEPNCMKCDNADRCSGDRCGPEYGWAGYRSTRDVRLDKTK